MSLYDILSERQHGAVFSYIFKVRDANPYADEQEKEKIVHIKITDILFDHHVCSLIHMQD